jgi:ribose 1,5-bisphosphokinase
MTGRLIAVVGPSGAGKDTLIAAGRAARPEILFARRQITRAAGAGGEDFDPVSPAGFATRLAAGAYAFHWHAHGMDYGIPAAILPALAEGRTVVFNGSRAALAAARAVWPGLEVALVTAPPEVLAERLARRGRERRDEIARRLARAGRAAPEATVAIDNGGRLAPAVRAFLAFLDRATETA